ALVNVSANLLGISTLALPWAMAESGFVPFVLVLCVVMLACRSTWKMLLDLSAFDGSVICRASYPELGRRVYGPEGHVAVLLAILLYSTGLMACQISALADILDLLMEDWRVLPLSRPRLAPVIVGAAACFPGVLLAAPRSMALAVGALLVASLLLTCLLLMAASETFPGAAEEPGASEDLDLGWGSAGGILDCAAVLVAQLAAHASFEETASVDTADAEEDFQRGPAADTVTAFTVAAPISLAMASAGYLRFGRLVQGDVLQSWHGATGPGAIVLRAARSAYAVVLVGGVALASKPCLATFNELAGNRRSMQGQRATPQHRGAAVLSFCALCAWLEEDLGHLLRLLGALGASPLVLLLPPLFHIEMARRQFGRDIFSLENLSAMFIMVLGVVITGGSLLKIITSSMSPPAGHRGERAVVSSLANITTHRWQR
ncbi:unnamed protein product, partial [Symbiodinium sp. CCMP2456]